MERRHADSLSNLFDQIHDQGAALLTGAQLLRWWGRKRLTQSIWADLQDRWAEAHSAPLLIGDVDGGYLLVWGEEGFLEPLSNRANAEEV